MRVEPTEVMGRLKLITESCECGLGVTRCGACAAIIDAINVIAVAPTHLDVSRLNAEVLRLNAARTEDRRVSDKFIELAMTQIEQIEDLNSRYVTERQVADNLADSLRRLDADHPALQRWSDVRNGSR